MGAAGVAVAVVVAVGVAVVVKMSSILHQTLERSNLAPRTREKYGRVIDSWIAFAGSDPRGWTKLRAQEFYDSMLARGVSTRSANVYVASLRYVSKWCAAQHGIDDFAVVQTKATGLSGAAGYDDDDTATPRHALEPETALRLLAMCTQGPQTLIERRDWTLMIVGLETGMRRMSLEAMRFDRIKVAAYPSVFVPIKGAGGNATYHVPLSDTARAAIEGWRGELPKWRRDGCVFMGFTKRMDPTNGRNVFTPGPKISASTIGKLISDRAAHARIEHVHPHLLRHTFITWRVAAGLSPVQVASITGHKPSAEWAGMTPYVDMAMIAADARNSTPPWLAKHVADELTRRKQS